MIPRNLPELFLIRANENENKILFEYKLRRNEPYRVVTWENALSKITQIAFGLYKLGVKKGDNVAILSNTRYEWGLIDLAILSLGAITVPLYGSLAEHAINYILNNSDCNFVFVEDKGQLQKIRSQWDSLQTVKRAIVISDLGDLPSSDERIITLKNLRDIGKLNLYEFPFFMEEKVKEINLDDVASIIYTSGTTGNPKGVVLTHGNILSVLESIKFSLPAKKNDKLLSFLPLSHVFERIGGFYFSIFNGLSITYCLSMDQIGPGLKDSNATIMLVVPRILEKLYSKITGILKLQTGLKKKLIDNGFLIGRRLFLEQCTPAEKLKLSLQYFFYDKLIFSKIRKSFAPTLRYFISGGAPLSKDIGAFFCILGIYVLEGYGLTETSAPATVNTLEHIKLGTVGRPLKDVYIKIAEDGEILIKGKNIFKGYYKNPEATKAVFLDDWFCSGDIGEIDKDGFLRITDRKKDLIISSSGKNIAPQNIEIALKSSDYISNAVVIGDRRKYLSALVTVDFLAVQEHFNNQGIVIGNDVSKDKNVMALIDSEIKSKTSDFSDYEQIKKFTILPNDFSIENGELTPTLKVKRKYVEGKFKTIIDSMYPND